MLGYELNISLAQHAMGGDVDGENVCIVFRLFADGDEVATDVVVDAGGLNQPPADLIDLLPLPMYLACPLGVPITVTQGDSGTVSFRFKRIAADLEEDQGYCFIDAEGRTVEVCRTCGDAYPPAGDGFDGECPNCADARDAAAA
jgi:hypothetical protein